MTTTAHRRILRDVLAWTQLQARILTAHGRANAYFTDFEPEELPHHHLRRGTAPTLTKAAPAWAVGCWARPLFSGGGAAMTGGRWRLTRRGAASRGESSASRELRFGRL